MSATPRKWGLDLLRAWAILLVLWLHSWEFFLGPDQTGAQKFALFGWSGVELFFVLSGYLVGSQALALESASGLLPFWRKRWLRTLPLYFLVLAVYLGLKPFLGFPFRDRAWSYFLFLQNYQQPRDFVQSWSLCIEEQFYLLLPLLLLLPGIRRCPPWVWLGGVLLSVLARWYVLAVTSPTTLSEAAYALQFPTHTHLDGLSIGVFLAATRTHWENWRVANRCALAGVGAVLLTLTYLFAFPHVFGNSALWIFTVLSVGYACLFPLACRLPAPRPAWLRVPVQSVALWSYGLYLWNNLIFHAAEKISLPSPWSGVLGWALTLAVSALTYYSVEKPALRARVWWERHASPAKLPPTPAANNG